MNNNTNETIMYDVDDEYKKNKQYNRNNEEHLIGQK